MHRKGNVHDFAITNGKGPRLHHFAYWVPTAMTSCICAGRDGLEWLPQGTSNAGPAVTGISNAFFCMVRDPMATALELYTGDYFTGTTTMSAALSLKDPRRQTLWGAAARVPGSSRDRRSRDRRYVSRCLSPMLPLRTRAQHSDVIRGISVRVAQP